LAAKALYSKPRHNDAACESVRQDYRFSLRMSRIIIWELKKNNCGIARCGEFFRIEFKKAARRALTGLAPSAADCFHGRTPPVTNRGAEDLVAEVGAKDMK
jgi:hypothetical protein